jgi:hypothetical protein
MTCNRVDSVSSCQPRRGINRYFSPRLKVVGSLVMKRIDSIALVNLNKKLESCLKEGGIVSLERPLQG